MLDHCFYLPLNHLFLSTIVPEQLYCNEKVIFCYKQIDSTRIAGGFCVSGISIFRNTKNSNALNWLKPKTFEYFYILFFSFTGKATKTVENRINNIPIPSFNVIFSLKTIHPITTPVNGSNVLSSDAITAPHKKVPF